MQDRILVFYGSYRRDRMGSDWPTDMDQGGWIDERSVMAYTIDVPAHRRKLVNEMHEETEIDTPLTRSDLLKRENEAK